MTKVKEHRLIEEFKSRRYFTREELADFYRYLEPNLNEGTFGWRISDLMKRNIIKPLKRGHYVISHQPHFKPDMSPHLLKTAKQISDKYGNVKHCIWETAWLNEFTQHQTSQSMLLIEIEKGFEDSLYYEFKDTHHNDVFINPDKNTIDYYITESKQPIVIKRLLSRAPLLKLSEKKVKVFIPSLEKMLVDLFADAHLFFYLQGSELIHIYNNAISNYTINFTKLFSYAKRREQEQKIKQFMTIHMFHLVKDVIDD